MAAARAPEPATIGVVIVSWNVRDLLRDCLRSLRAAGLPSRVVVVDNASADGSADMVRAEFPEVTLLASPSNQGFTIGNNLGLRALGLGAGADAPAAPRYVLLLNPDAALLPGALAQLVDYLERHPRVGAVGPRLLYPDGSPQSSCRRFPGLY